MTIANARPPPRRGAAGRGLVAVVAELTGAALRDRPAERAESQVGRGKLWAHLDGLLLALVPGGSCDGIALCIATSDVESATRLLWVREMVWRAYRASWLPLADHPAPALTFTVDTTHPSHVGALPPTKQAARIAGARQQPRVPVPDQGRALTTAGLRDGYVDQLFALVSRA